MKFFPWGPVIAVLCAPLQVHSEKVEPGTQTAVVCEFIKAFNAQDAMAMATMVADDIQWYSIDAAAVSVEVSSKPALVEAMTAYFASCPTCRSTISGLTSSAQRVSAVEIASWNSASGPKSQQSIAVYEFSGALIKAVYYFPAEPVSPARGPGGLESTLSSPL